VTQTNTVTFIESVFSSLGEYNIIHDHTIYLNRKTRNNVFVDIGSKIIAIMKRTLNKYIFITPRVGGEDDLGDFHITSISSFVPRHSR
jgi:hypothetical protein